MELNQHLKRILLISASALMVASVGGTYSSFANTSTVNAKSTKVVHKHSHKSKQKSIKKLKSEIRHSHSAIRWDKKQIKSLKHKHSKKSKKAIKSYQKKMANHKKDLKSFNKKLHKLDKGKHGFVRHRAKEHHGKYTDTLGWRVKKHIMHDHFHHFHGLYRDGFKDGSHTDLHYSFTHDGHTYRIHHTVPEIDYFYVGDVSGKASHNYEEGWIDGYVNGNYDDYLRPSLDTRVKLYANALKEYNVISNTMSTGDSYYAIKKALHKNQAIFFTETGVSGD